MQYRTDRRTGNKLSVLGLGCMRFPKSEEETERLILRAVERGVNYFDTAYIYWNSEETLGNILKKHDLRKKVFLSDKLPLLICRGPRDFDRFFSRQLERLQTDYIDYYLMHMITDLQLWKKFCDWGIKDWIEEKKERGAIRQVGFSFHGARDEFLAVLDAYDWGLCQVQYNYSDENYQAGVAGVKKAAEKGIPIVIMEPLLGGKLATGLPQKALNIFREVSSERSPAEWALRWLWNQPEVTVVLSGMNHVSQVEENTETAGKALPGMITEAEQEAFRAVSEIFRESNQIPCTGCGYCMPCPQHVNIPACFSAYNTAFLLGRRIGIQQYTTSIAPLSEQESRAGLCINCGICRKRCPQNIPVPEALKEVQRRLEPWWYLAGTRIARRIMGRHKHR